ncbi:MAG: RraA family protein [Actinomycetota bacterium]|nr:RraA family protein [Actinomycetota bacterium]
MTPGPGFRIRSNDLRPNDDTIAGFRQFETPDISDLMNRLYTMNTAIRPLTQGDLGVIGPACTVKVFPGDNLMVHKALDVARPGDVIVVDASSSTMTAVLGDTICMKARHRGIAGVVVDGVIRDLPAILRLGNFPVFARGTTPIGPLHRGPGEINLPICAGGIVVSPGDLIVGDLNGVVVVPREITGEILQRLINRAAAQQEYLAAVARGDFSNAWVDRVLEEANLEVPGPTGLNADAP